MAAKTIYMMLFLSAMTIFLHKRGNAKRDDLQRVSGRIADMGTPEINGILDGRMSMIRLVGFEKIFVMPVSGDDEVVHPELMRLDELRLGDLVDVFFDGSYGIGDRTIESVIFIDKENKPCFVHGGSGDRQISYFIWGLSTITIIVILILKKLGEIS